MVQWRETQLRQVPCPDFTNWAQQDPQPRKMLIPVLAEKA